MARRSHGAGRSTRLTPSKGERTHSGAASTATPHTTVGAASTATPHTTGVASTAHSTVRERHTPRDTQPAGSKPRTLRSISTVSEATSDHVWRRDSRPSRPSLPAEQPGRGPVGKDQLLQDAGEEQRGRRGREYTDPEAESALTATRTVQAERARETGAPRVDQMRCGTNAFASAATEARRARLKREALEAEPASHLGNTKPSPAELVRIRLTTHKDRALSSGASLGDGARLAAEAKGKERNAKRLREADAADRATLGESPSFVRSRVPSFLPGDAALFFHEPIVGPVDENEPPPGSSMRSGPSAERCRRPHPSPRSGSSCRTRRLCTTRSY